MGRRDIETPIPLRINNFFKSNLERKIILDILYTYILFFSIFVRVYLTQTDDMPGSKISERSPENNSSAVSFMHLKLRWERKEDYVKMGRNNRSITLQES